MMDSHFPSDVVGVIAGFLPATTEEQQPLMLVSHSWYQGVVGQDGMAFKPEIQWPVAALRMRRSRLVLPANHDVRCFTQLAEQYPDVEHISVPRTTTLSLEGLRTCSFQLKKVKLTPRTCFTTTNETTLACRLPKQDLTLFEPLDRAPGTADPMGFNAKTDPQHIPISMMPQFEAMLKSDDPQEQMHGTMMIRKLISIQQEGIPVVDDTKEEIDEENDGEDNEEVEEKEEEELEDEDNDEVVDHNEPPSSTEKKVAPTTQFQVSDIGAIVAQLRRDDMPSLQLESAWLLTNLAMDATAASTILHTENAVENLIHLLLSSSSSCDECREQAVWALGNLCGHGAQSRTLVIRCGAVTSLTNMLGFDDSSTQEKLNLKTTALWVLANVCRFKPPPPISATTEIISAVLPILSGSSTHMDSMLSSLALWFLSFASDGSNERIQAIVDADIIPTVVSWLKSPQVDIIAPATRIIGNIVSGNDRQTQAVIDAGALNALTALVNHPYVHVRKEVCWTLSNILAGTKDQIGAVLENQRLITLILGATADSEQVVCKEATWAISCAASGGSHPQIAQLVELGGFDCICEVIRSTADEPKILSVALEALEMMLQSYEDYIATNGIDVNPLVARLKDGGYVPALEELQHHQNEDVSLLIVNLLEAYFNDHDD